MREQRPRLPQGHPGSPTRPVTYRAARPSRQLLAKTLCHTASIAQHKISEEHSRAWR